MAKSSSALVPLSVPETVVALNVNAPGVTAIAGKATSSVWLLVKDPVQANVCVPAPSISYSISTEVNVFAPLFRNVTTGDIVLSHIEPEGSITAVIPASHPLGGVQLLVFVNALRTPVITATIRVA